MKYIHASDFHLCSPFSHGALSAKAAVAHRVQLWKTFKNVIDICQTQKADILLISGDLFEASNAKITDYKRASDAFAAIPDTRVFISCGNHDPLNRESYYNSVSFPENVFIFPNRFTRVELKELKVSVYGYSWAQNAYSAPEFVLNREDDGNFPILCLHCDAIDRTSRYMSVELKDIIAANFGYSALGHIHKPTVLTDSIRYCGSAEPLDFSETGLHGVIMGEYANGVLTTKFINCAAREFIDKNIELEPQMNYNDIISLMREAAGSDPYSKLCRFTFSGNIDSAISIAAITEELEDEFAYLKVVDGTIPDYDIESLKKDNEGNIIGEYIKRLTELSSADAVAKKALYYGIEALTNEYAGGKKIK